MVNGLSSKVGMTVTEMMPGILEGKIKSLYILGEDPVMSDRTPSMSVTALKNLIPCFAGNLPSETSVYADVLLLSFLCREDRHVHEHGTTRADGQ